MAPIASLSSKLALVADHGFALRQSRQPGYSYAWHKHDCAMLLWPRRGSLRSAWMADGEAQEPVGAQATELTRGTAILLPRLTPHATRSASRAQQHGELYLAPDVLDPDLLSGPLRLDPAAMAMLDALLEPRLGTRAAEHLVHAVIEQVVSGTRAPAPALPMSVPQRLVRRYAACLQWDEALPPIDTIAAELGVSARQLQRLCQAELGMSPVDIRRRLLAARARELLAEGQSHAAVSVQLGFSSSGHLGRLLRGL